MQVYMIKPIFIALWCLPHPKFGSNVTSLLVQTSSKIWCKCDFIVVVPPPKFGANVISLLVLTFSKIWCKCDFIVATIDPVRNNIEDT